MNLIWEKMYYRVQNFFVFLQKKMLQKKLRLKTTINYRLDLLKTIYPIRGVVNDANALIDIGANKGEFTQAFSHVYDLKLLICIEPNPALNDSINENNKAGNPIIINKAISDKETDMDFYFHTDTQMSSLFTSDKNLIKRDFQEDDAEAVVKRVIPVTTLNAVFEEYKNILSGKTIFLKIDTQGNELEVIRGGDKMLSAVSYCLLEYMFQSPYEKQYLFEEIINIMSSQGFECLGPMHISQRVTGEVGAVLFLFGKKGNI